MYKILSVVGARPQFVKAGVLSPVLQKSFKEILVHTGQHYDVKMSDIFFKDLPLPEPAYHLEIKPAEPKVQQAKMVGKLKALLFQEKPDAILVYGDTTSTLAGALVASEMKIPLVHVEAGLRSFDSSMPEEGNRIQTDQLSDLLCVPTEVGMKNLAEEGFLDKAVLTGDVMCDAVFQFKRDQKLKTNLCSDYGVQNKKYALMTLHRAGVTAQKGRMESVIKGLASLKVPLLFPIHPRTHKQLDEWGLLSVLEDNSNIHLLEPLGYFDFLSLLYSSQFLLTDSGGVQKEACLLKVPCITLREQTEWLETLDSGWNTLVGYESEKMGVAIKSINRLPDVDMASYYGDGMACENIVRVIKGLF
jgi:UDP-N-acetylglucosamine 2-epimerase